MRRVLIMCLALTACGTASARLAAPSPTSDGPLYGASGRVVSVPGRAVRFCPNVGLLAVLITPAPPPAYCDLGVDVVGVDLDRLADRREQAGAVEGQASLTGTWDGTTLTVRTQSAPTRDDGLLGTFTDPPCPAPADGWPRGTANENLDATALQAYQSSHADEVLNLAFARPSSTQVVAYLLTTGDVQAAEAALRPTYGARLCVGRSRYTRAQFDAARDDVMKHFSEIGLSSGAGEEISTDGQAQTGADAVVLTPALEALVARHPAGLVDVRPWLKPVATAP